MHREGTQLHFAHNHEPPIKYCFWSVQKEIETKGCMHLTKQDETNNKA